MNDRIKKMKNWLYTGKDCHIDCAEEEEDDQRVVDPTVPTKTKKASNEDDDDDDDGNLTLNTEQMDSGSMRPQDVSFTNATIGEEDEEQDEADDVNFSLEVEMKGPANRFVHIITSSYPFQVIVAGESRWLGSRRSRITAGLIFAFLFLLMVSIPPSQRRKRSSSPAKEFLKESPPKVGGQQSEDSEVKDDEPEIKPSVARGDDGSTPLVEVRDTLVFPPFSVLDPAEFFPVTDRPQDSRPSSRLSSLKEKHSALPTNAWYQNLLLLQDGENSTQYHGAYTQPYFVDVGGPIPGLRMQMGAIDGTTDQVIVADGTSDALTLGVALSPDTTTDSVDKGYNVVAANPLGLTLEWTYFGMRSSIVQGMPYITMTYPPPIDPESTGLPTIFIPRQLNGPILVDEGTTSEDCGSSFSVASEIEMTLTSGVTYLIFLSSPQVINCVETSDGGTFLQILHSVQSDDLTVRAARVIPSPDSTRYSSILRTYSNIYPGENTTVGYEVGSNQAALVFDWDPKISREKDGNQDMIMFAMPHHQDRINTVTSNCASVLLGSVCLVVGTQWKIVENLPRISFRAPRGPDSDMIPDLMEAISDDINYRVPDNFLTGAGDTYFSGKALGKLARILLITEELVEICGQSRLRRGLQPTAACGQGTLPNASAIEEALTHLKAAVEIWLSIESQAPFVFDDAWGGIVSCGCIYSGGNCENVFPNCPGLSDRGLNFGAGFYSDHHFHYGYHIYAAATVAHFDPEWGRNNFERVLLLVRDIANPSLDDPFFPQARHKDWFQGSSWASGISLPVSPTGMNQESTSEAIAAYEAVALFGKTMASILEDSSKVEVAQDIYQYGRLLTATEVRSAQRYWQVSQDEALLDEAYQHSVVGILWSSKLFFGTWFSSSPYCIYGIQLMPITPISEERDDVNWLRRAYHPYAASCDGRCVSDGWSIQILAMLATLGHKEKALSHAQDLGDSSFEVAGGSGHSLSNTIWYISTRRQPDEPLVLDQTYEWEAGPWNVTCFKPETCTDSVLDAMAGDYSCRSRIEYVVNSMGKTEYEACYQVGVTEFPNICGGCSPASEDDSKETTTAPSTFKCSQSNCTSSVLAAAAGAFTCGDRIDYLINGGMSEVEACSLVAGFQFPAACG